MILGSKSSLEVEVEENRDTEKEGSGYGDWTGDIKQNIYPEYCRSNGSQGGLRECNTLQCVLL